MYKILFVCTGNICRSPAAEGVLRQQLKAHGLEGKILVDSAGTHGYHTGEAPDARAIKAAKKRHVSIDGLRARQVGPADFTQFDLILALDASHLRFLKHMQPDETSAEIAMFLPYAGANASDVPDPYYGGISDFEYMMDLLETHMPAAIERIKSKLLVS